MIDFERVKLLLDVFHGTLNVPGADYIRDQALDKIRAIANTDSTEPVEAVESNEPTLDLGTRRV